MEKRDRRLVVGTWRGLEPFLLSEAMRRHVQDHHEYEAAHPPRASLGEAEGVTRRKLSWAASTIG